MAQSPFEALVSGIKTGREVGTDIAQSNILQKAYEGADASTMTPEMQQGVYQKAAVLAGQKGLGSLAYSFQKEASALSKDAAETQVNQLKAQQGKLELATQYAQGANSVEDLRKAYEIAGASPEQKMYIEGILRRQLDPDPQKDFELKKEEVKRMGLTANQDVMAQIKATQAQVQQERVDIMRDRLLDQERNGANSQAAKKEKEEAKNESQYNKEVTNVQRDFDRQRARINSDPFMKPKDKQKALDDIDQREDQRIADLDKRYHPTTKETTPSKPAEKPTTAPSETKPTQTKEDKDVYIVPGTDIGYVKPKNMTDKQWEDWKKNEAPKDSTGIEKKLPSRTAVKDYADKYFGGNIDKALEYLKKQGYK